MVAPYCVQSRLWFDIHPVKRGWVEEPARLWEQKAALPHDYRPRTCASECRPHHQQVIGSRLREEQSIRAIGGVHCVRLKNEEERNANKKTKQTLGIA